MKREMPFPELEPYEPLILKSVLLFCCLIFTMLFLIEMFEVMVKQHRYRRDDIYGLSMGTAILWAIFYAIVIYYEMKI